MAEYITLSDCACNCAWYKIFFGELGKPMPFIPIYGDSHGAIFNAQNPVTLKGIKHIEICYHYIREQIEKGEVKVFTIPTSENVADMFTKNLGPTLFLKYRKELGIKFYPLWSCVHRQVCVLPLHYLRGSVDINYVTICITIMTLKQWTIISHCSTTFYSGTQKKCAPQMEPNLLITSWSGD